MVQTVKNFNANGIKVTAHLVDNQDRISNSVEAFFELLSFWDLDKLKNDKSCKALCLDARDNLISIISFSNDLHKSNSEIFFRSIAKNTQAEKIVIGENNPRYDILPDAETKEFVQNLKEASNRSGIFLKDYLALKPHSYFSYSDHKLM